MAGTLAAMRITALAGGVGGARFLRGLRAHLDRTPGPRATPSITVIGNTGDDITPVRPAGLPRPGHRHVHPRRRHPRGAGLGARGRDARRAGRARGVRRACRSGSASATATSAPTSSAASARPGRAALRGDRAAVPRAGGCPSSASRLLPMTDTPVETHVVVDDDEGQRARSTSRSGGCGMRAAVPAQRFVAVGMDRATAGPGRARRDPRGRRRAAAAEQPGRLDRHHPRRARGAGRAARQPGARRRRLPAHRRRAGARPRRRLPRGDRRRVHHRGRGRALRRLPGRLARRRRGRGAGLAPPTAASRCAPGRCSCPTCRGRRRSPAPRWTWPSSCARRRRDDALLPSRSPLDPRLTGHARGARRRRPGRAARWTRLAAERDGAARTATCWSSPARSSPRRSGCGRAGRRPRRGRGRARRVRVVAERDAALAGSPGSSRRRRAGDGRGRASTRPTPAGRRVLLLPQDPDAEARDLRAAILRAGAGRRRSAVVLSDTAGRPWRDGQTDFALGAAGLRVVDDLRGGHRRRRTPAERDRPRRRRTRSPPRRTWSRARLAACRPPSSAGWRRRDVTEDDGPGAALAGAGRRPPTGSGSATSRPSARRSASRRARTWQPRSASRRPCRSPRPPGSNGRPAWHCWESPV